MVPARSFAMGPAQYVRSINDQPMIGRPVEASPGRPEGRPMSATPIDIKRVSPLDAIEPAPIDLVQIRPLATKLQWVASKYNLRTTSADGSYVLWNSYTGAICVFKPQQREGVQALLKQGYSGEPKGVVKYLADNGFLVLKGTNEYRQVQLA